METEPNKDTNQINSANPMNGLTDAFNRNVTNTYSKVFGDPSMTRRTQEENKSSFEDAKTSMKLQNKSEQNLGLAGTNKTIQNMTNMLNTITENLDKDKNNGQSQINLEGMMDFFKNNEKSNDSSTEPSPVPQNSPNLQSSSSQQQNTETITKEQRKTNSREDFHKKMYDSIYKAANERGLSNSDVLARLGASQASLESGHGKKMPKDSNNPFGIKETRKDKPSTTNETREVIDNKSTNKREKFRKYDKVEDSGKDWLDLIQKDSRYKDVLESKDLKSATNALGNSGYFTEDKDKYLKNLNSIMEKYGKNIEKQEPTQKAEQLPQKEEKPNITSTNANPDNMSEQIAQVSTQENKPQIQSAFFTPGEQNYGKATLNPEGKPSAEKEPVNNKPVNEPYMMQPPGSLPKDFNLQKMPATGTAIPEQIKPTKPLAEIQEQPQRQTGEQLSNMAEEQTSNRDQMSVPQAPIINNVSGGSGGSGMQSVPQSSASNAPIASVRNEENAFVRMQNMIAMQALS